MSWTGLGDLTGWGSAAAAQTAITFTGIAIPANTLLVFGWDCNVASITATCADNSSQSGAANSYTTPGSLNGTTFTSGVFYCFTTRALLTTDTITITLSAGASRTSAAGAMYSVTSNNPILDTSASVRVAATASPVTTSASGTLHQASELGVAFSFIKTGAVATGTTFGASQINSPSTHTEWNSGGTVTTVATRFADGLTIATTTGTTSWSYTAGFANVNLQTLFFYEGPAISTDFPLQAAQHASQSMEKPSRYKAPPSVVSGPFDNTTAGPVAWCPAPITRREKPVAWPPSRNSNTFDPLGNSFRDWTPQPAQNRPVPFYKGPPPTVVPVWDPLTNTFADWAPAPVIDKPVPYYGPPREQSVVAWGASIVTDAYAPQAADSSPTGLYRGSYSAMAQAADELIADPWAITYQGRPVPFYRAPLSTVVPVYDQPTQVFGTDFAMVAQGYRPPFFYRGPLSLVIPAFTPNPGGGTDWAAAYQGNRAFPDYRAPLSQTIPVWDPATNTFADWTPGVIIDKAPPFYGPPRESFVTSWGQSIVTDAYVGVSASRAVAFYRSMADTFVTSWGASIVTDQLAPVAQSRIVPFYRGAQSLVTLAADNAALVAQGYAPVIQNRVLDLRALATRSLAIFPDGPVVVAALPPSGGGGEWVIWGKPDFPGNRGGAWPTFKRPDFRRPDRNEKRGY